MSLYSPFTFFKETARLLFQKRVKDGQLAFLGDTDGPGARTEVPDAAGYLYARFRNVPDANGNLTYSAPFLVRSGQAAFQNYPGASVYVAVGYNGELEIVSANYQELTRNGIDTRTLNPLHQQSKWVYLWQLTIGLASAVGNSVNSSYLVTVKKYRRYFDNVFAASETGAQADKIDLQSYVPGVDMHRYAAVWLDAYTGTFEVTTSTTQSLFTTLDDTDVQELVVHRPPDAVPHKAFYLANNQGTITQQPVADRDLRQFLNMPQVHGFPNPVAYRERIHPDKQQLFAGSLVVTGSLEVLGSLIGVPTASGSGTGSAPSTGWQDDGTVVRLVTTTDNVNIGGTTDLGKLAVDGDADEIQLLVQGNGTQTALLAVFEDSAGNDQVTISADGAMVINEEGNDVDLRVESDTNTNGLVFDGSNTGGLGIGAAPDAAAALDTSSTTRVSRPFPRLTDAERAAITAPDWSLWVNTDTLKLYQRVAGLDGVTRDTPFLVPNEFNVRMSLVTYKDPYGDLSNGTTIYFAAVNGGRIVVPTGYRPLYLPFEYDDYWDMTIEYQKTVTGNTTNGNATITNLSSTLGLCAGMAITGTGIPGSTTISSVNHSAGTLLLSANATATNTGVTLTVTLAANKNYDVYFQYDVTQGLRYILDPWTSATARSATLAFEDGMWQNNIIGGAAVPEVGRYIGSIRTNATSHFEDQVLKRFVFNVDHPTRRLLNVVSSLNSFADTNTGIHQYNSSTVFQVEVLIGLQDHSLADLMIVAYPQVAGQRAAVGYDSTSTFDTPNIGQRSAADSFVTGWDKLMPDLGYHVLSMNVTGAAGTGAWNGVNTNFYAGMRGGIFM